jgi:hypothetical protein
VSLESILEKIQNLKNAHITNRCLDCGQIVYGEHNASHTFTSQVEIPLSQWESLEDLVQQHQKQQHGLDFVTSLLLDMLDKALNNLESQHKTGSRYWVRLRIRKRLVQTIMYLASEDDPKKVKQELFEEFFKKSDRQVLGGMEEDR